MRKWAPSLAWVYALILYGFIFLPVIMLVLFSFQETMFPVPPFNGPSLRWYRTVLADARLTSALVNSLALAISTTFLMSFLQFNGFEFLTAFVLGLGFSGGSAKTIDRHLRKQD